MDANGTTAAPAPSRPPHDRWLAVVSGEAVGPAAALARLGLSLLALPYRAGLAAGNLRWRLPGVVKRAPCPVISVGNLTVGGTGKTPMVAYLAGLVTAMHRRPLIVSRGYGRTSAGPNEEALELARLCPDVPHVQNPDRLRAVADWAADHPCDVAILDDGFQHRRLARDLDIVLIDALCPFGYGRVLPRGLLREPVSALRRADVVVVTRADLADADDLARLKRALADLVGLDVPLLTAEHRATAVILPDGSRRAADWLRGQDVAAACGIGNPEAFRRTLEALGARVRLFRTFRDHHAYTREDLDGLVRESLAAGVKTLVTTGKDHVKWLPLGVGGMGAMGAPALGVAALEVALRIVDGEEALRRRIGTLLAGSAREAGR
ncbi:MAG: tetraacyldisaccharide 4'-kinase [Planctomycetes bacterium]|nr:tetraacyldisaccharide 4'-kinase [Planctomycetota bacterium]